MTAAEFDQWFADYCAAFPDIPSWINKSPNPIETLRHWCKTLSGCSLEHALEATRRLADGRERIDYPTNTARDVRAICGRIAGMAATGEKQLRQAALWKKRAEEEGRPKWSMADVLRRMRMASENGESLSVDDAILESMEVESE